MSPETTIFKDLAYVFLAAVGGGLLARRLRQPLILGYVVGGIVVGRFTPGPSISDLHSLESLAELGVILLMYSIGLEFSGRDLMRVKWVAILGGPLGIVFSIGLSLLLGQVLGWSNPQSIAIGAVISVASTMVLSRLLIDRGELHSRHGSVMIGMTLVEDVAVVLMTILLPLMSPSSTADLRGVAIAFGKSALLLIPIGLAAYKLVPPIMTRVARTRSEELYLLVALAIGLATAVITQKLGFSLALGAFLAGMVVSESEYKHQTLAQLLPLRDAFVALFFVTIGALVDPATLLANLPLLATLVGMVIVGKFFVWGAVVLIFGYGFWTAVLVAVGLTQIGEFSFILVQVSRNAGLVGNDVYNATLAASLVTILINAALVRVVPEIVARKRSVADGKRLKEAPVEEMHNHVVICGFGRIGSVIGAALETAGTPYIVIEIDPDVVKALRLREVHALFGDPAHAGILEEARVRDAALVIFALPQLDRARLASELVRKLNPSVPILARAHSASDRSELLNVGVTEVVEPENEASIAMIMRALKLLNTPDEEASSLVGRIREAMDVAPRDSALKVPYVQEIVIGRESSPSGTIGQEHVRERFGVTILAIARDSQTIVNPSATTRLESGDRVRVFGLPKDIHLFRAWLRESV